MRVFGVADNIGKDTLLSEIGKVIIYSAFE